MVKSAPKWDLCDQKHNSWWRMSRFPTFTTLPQSVDVALGCTWLSWVRVKACSKGSSTMCHDRTEHLPPSNPKHADPSSCTPDSPAGSNHPDTSPTRSENFSRSEGLPSFLPSRCALILSLSWRSLAPINPSWGQREQRRHCFQYPHRAGDFVLFINLFPQ